MTSKGWLIAGTLCQGVLSGQVFADCLGGDWFRFRMHLAVHDEPNASSTPSADCFTLVLLRLDFTTGSSVSHGIEFCTRLRTLLRVKISFFSFYTVFSRGGSVLSPGTCMR
jgi:hypothetical protein